jgi:hypothetical protein
VIIVCRADADEAEKADVDEDDAADIATTVSLRALWLLCA